MARIPCQLNDIFESARSKLIAAGVGTDSQCYITLEPEELQHTPALPDQALFSFSFRDYAQFPTTLSCEDTVETASTMQGELIVNIWVRMALDPQGSENVTLADQSYGISEKIRQIQATFNNEELLDADGNGITWRTLTYLDYRNARRGKDQEWRRIEVRFDCCYEADPTATGMTEFPLAYDDAGSVLSYDGTNSLVYA